MAPKKRISRIPTRAVIPEMETVDGLGRSIGIQTDPELNNQFAPQPTKRQKILEKIKQLNKSKQPDMASSSLSSSSTLSSFSVLKAMNLYPKAIEPGDNEKACQVKESELDAVPFRPKSDFAIKMERLKTQVDRRHMESIIWDIERLNTLDDLINHDPPPRWSVACEMWLEVDQLEARIESFCKKVERKKNKKN